MGYWEDRFEQLEQAQTDKAAPYYNNVYDQYDRAARDTEKEISKWYARYATENQITLTEAKRRLNGRELAEFRMDIKDYIKKGETLGYSNEWQKQLEAASVKRHVNRLEALKVQMQQQAEAAGAFTRDEIDKLARTTYTDGYYQTAFEIQKGLGVGWDFARLDAAKVDKVLVKPWTADGSNFSTDVWTNTKKLVGELNTELTQNIIRGLSPQNLIKIIAKRFEVTKNKAGRLIMTENAFFASASKRDVFKELGVEKYEIVATLDGRTSEKCRDFDGRVEDVADYMPGSTAPPFHPWCRTTTAPFFDDEFTAGEERAARDESGQYYKIPANTTYRQWEKAFVDGSSKKAFTAITKAKIEKQPKDK